MRTLDAPLVDMLAVAKSSRLQRRAILGFAPKIGLNVIDYGVMDGIDNFYLECQTYRDYYRDPYNKLHKPPLFRVYQGKCGVKLDHSVDDLLKPVKWVTEPQPVVYPVEYGREMNIDAGIQLQGKYEPSSCNRYKR